MKKFDFHSLYFFIVPLLVLFIFVREFQNIGYNWCNGGYDSSYCYLLNSLSLATGHSVGHIDHPGTPLQVFGVLIIFLTWLFEPSKKDLITSVLTQPELYLAAITWTVASINFVIIFFIGRAAFKLAGNLWQSMILQLTPLFSAYLLFTGFGRVSPEQFILMSSMLIVLLMIFYLEKGQTNPMKYAFLFAFVTGFGIASKFTFFLVMIIPLIVLVGWKKKLIYFVTSIATFFVCTLPVSDQYGSMFDWLKKLFNHAGIYGSGKETIIDLTTYLISLKEILSANYIFVIVLTVSIFSATYFIVRLKKNKKPIWVDDTLKFFVAIIICQIAGLLMVAKHFSPHYLVPFEAFMGANIFLLLRFTSFIKKKFALPVIFLGLIVIFGFINNKLYVSNNNFNDEYLKAGDKFKLYNNNYAKIVGYAGGSIEAALKFGNVYSTQIFSDALQRIYPNTFFYDINADKFYEWIGETDLDYIIAKFGDKIVFNCFTLDMSTINRLAARGLYLKKINSANKQAVYELASKPVLKKKISYIDCNLETLTSDKQYFIATNGKDLFSGTSMRTEHFSKSGKYSVLLSKSQPFGLTYHCNDVTKGDEFIVSAWCNKHDHKTVIVASDTTAKFFYINSDFIDRFDEKGWKRMSLKFKVPVNIPDGKLLFYVWDSGNDSIFIDDMQIIKKTRFPEYQIYCNAENRTSDGNFFTAEPNKDLIQSGNLQTSEKAHSGKFAIKLTKDAPYGMTCEFNQVIINDKFNVSVWRYGGDKNAAIIASSADGKEFYTGACEVVQTEPSGWQLLNMNFKIPVDLTDNVLKIYLWNSGANDVFFDDFTIKFIGND